MRDQDELREAAPTRDGVSLPEAIARARGRARPRARGALAARERRRLPRAPHRAGPGARVASIFRSASCSGRSASSAGGSRGTARPPMRARRRWTPAGTPSPAPRSWRSIRADRCRGRGQLERELGRAGEGVAAPVHRRRAGMGRLAVPRDARALDPERPEHDAEREVHRLEHRALLDVQLEVGRRVCELRARLERAVELDAVLAQGVRQRDPVAVGQLRAARPGRASSRPPPTSRRASGRSARPPRRPS